MSEMNVRYSMLENILLVRQPLDLVRAGFPPKTARLLVRIATVKAMIDAYFSRQTIFLQLTNRPKL